VHDSVADAGHRCFQTPSYHRYRACLQSLTATLRRSVCLPPHDDAIIRGMLHRRLLLRINGFGRETPSNYIGVHIIISSRSNSNRCPYSLRSTTACLHAQRPPVAWLLRLSENRIVSVILLYRLNSATIPEYCLFYHLRRLNYIFASFTVCLLLDVNRA